MHLSIESDIEMKLNLRMCEYTFHSNESRWKWDDDDEHLHSKMKQEKESDAKQIVSRYFHHKIALSNACMYYSELQCGIIMLAVTWICLLHHWVGCTHHTK